MQRYSNPFRNYLWTDCICPTVTLLQPWYYNIVAVLTFFHSLDLPLRPLISDGQLGVLAYTIGTLFDALSTWDKSAVVGSQGLVLELTARHTPPTGISSDIEKFKSLFTPNPKYSLSSLPKVNVVTTLLISQNTFAIPQPRIDALHKVLRSLPALRKMRYVQRARIAFPESERPERGEWNTYSTCW